MPGDWRFIVAARSLDAVRMRCCLRIGYRATDAAGISTRRIPDILILEMNDAFIKALRRKYGKIPDVEGMRLGGHDIGQRFLEDGYVYRIV